MSAKIAFVSTTAQFYGAPQSLILLLASLDRTRFRPVVFCPYDGPLVERLRAMDVPVVLGAPDVDPDEFRSSSKLSRALTRGPQYLKRLSRMLREERPDLVYLNTIGVATPAVLAWLQRVPTIVHVRESRSYLLGTANRLRRYPLLHTAQRFVAVSGAIRDVLIEAGAPAGRIDVVYNGADLDACRFDSEARAEIRAELGIAADAPLVGLVGAIEPRKGVADFVEAAGLLAGDHPDLHFAVIGGVKNAEYAAHVERRIAELGLTERMHLCGFRNDAMKVFSALDVVANPTLEEPFARVNVEAMAAGRPVVATRVDGNPEAVVDGETGLIVEPNDPAGLARALGSLVSDPERAARMGDAARKRAEKKFAAEHYVAGVEAVLERELEGQRATAGDEEAGPTASRAYFTGGVAQLLWKVLDVGLGFGSVWLLTHLLAPGAYGELLVALSIVTLLELSASGGFERIILFRIARMRGEEARKDAAPLVASTLRWAMGLSVAAAVGLTFAAGAVGNVFGNAAMAVWLPLIAWRVPAQAGRAIYSAWYQAEQRVATSVVVGQLLPAVLTVALLATVFLLGLGPSYVAGALVAGVALTSVVFFVRRPVPLFGRHGGMSVVDATYGAKLMLAGFVNKCVRMTDILMLGALAASDVTGRFGVAAKLAVLALFAHRALGSVLTPRIGHHFGTGDLRELEREYSRVRAVSLGASLGIVAILAGLGPFALSIFGDYQQAYPALLILLAAYVVPVAFGANGAFLNMAGHGGWSLSTSVALLVLNIALNALLIPIWGMVGAAIATLIAMIGVNSLMSGVVWRLHAFRTLSIDVIVCAAATIIALLCGAAELPPAGTASVVLVVAAAFAFRRRDALRLDLMPALPRSRRARA